MHSFPFQAAAASGSLKIILALRLPLHALRRVPRCVAQPFSGCPCRAKGSLKSRFGLKYRFSQINKTRKNHVRHPIIAQRFGRRGSAISHARF
ncbi:hypothetical protein GCWU000324_02682 [Kingella oralis ATCC 51147]|uniref:Uncharacterized protein n=1 Tax=Kingella oralis ATCC 51147 TaxID=629741 RepID=C4GLV9_9NEIS|nr:hypothetical protein GCWU000324_02682 [Kingella oralis ATCC 51147]